jgi:hypothetical protein
LVSDKEAAELEELLALFKLGLGETEQFAAALQVRPKCSMCSQTTAYASVAAKPSIVSAGWG